MNTYKVQDETFTCWTQAQDRAIEHLHGGIVYVMISVWSECRNRWECLQELNLKRGIIPKPHFSTWTLAPYYVKLKNVK